MLVFSELALHRPNAILLSQFRVEACVIMQVKQIEEVLQVFICLLIQLLGSQVANFFDFVRLDLVLQVLPDAPFVKVAKHETQISR